jgi:hypothetical protein
MVYRKKESRKCDFLYPCSPLISHPSHSTSQVQCYLQLHLTIQGPRKEREMAAGRRLTWYEEVAVPKRKDAGKSLRRMAEAHGRRRSHSSEATATTCRIRDALPAMCQLVKARQMLRSRGRSGSSRPQTTRWPLMDVLPAPASICFTVMCIYIGRHDGLRTGWVRQLYHPQRVRKRCSG